MALLDQTMTLPSGRRLAYDVYGDPAGRPVFFFHGLPGTRRGASILSEHAAARGLALLSPDRPGLGLSDAQPGRRILDWPSDVAALADRLGHPRFAVLGVSGGGSYAAAAAYALPERITTAYLVSSIGPLDDPEALAAMMPMNRIMFGLLRKYPSSSRILAAFAELAFGRRFDRVLEKSLPRIPPPDAWVLRDPGIRKRFADEARETFRQGSRGYAQEQSLLTDSWGFALQDIRVPVHVFHGAMDQNAPIALGKRIAALIPNCRSSFYDDEGHCLIISRASEILSALACDWDSQTHERQRD